MSKNIAITDEVIHQLDEIRKQKGYSYNQVIKLLLTPQGFSDLKISETNKAFFHLEDVFCDTKEIVELLEVMRMTVIKCHKMPDEIKKENIFLIQNLLLERIRQTD